MAQVTQLPCDGDGICMVCKQKQPSHDTRTCTTCATPWHLSCVLAGDGAPKMLAGTLQWDCPDCSPANDSGPQISRPTDGSGDLIAAIHAIELDASLTEQEKMKRHGSAKLPDAVTVNNNDALDIFDGSLNCSFCMQLPERPVTTPCGHNFCLKCFEKWIGQGKRTCADCRNEIPSKMANQPRINSQLAIAIRKAKVAKSYSSVGGAPPRDYHFMHNQNRPDKAFATERAKKAGRANACSGKIFVTVPPDHFGPITAESDRKRNQGV